MGRCLTNGHVAKMTLAARGGLVLNTDSHAPDDLITTDWARNIALGAGLEEKNFSRITLNAQKLIKRVQ